MEGRDVIGQHPIGAIRELDHRRENPPGGFSHAALLYRDPDEYVSQITDFVRAGAEAPLQAVLPWGDLLQVREVLPIMSAGILVTDMTELGRNPARLIAAGLTFAAEYPAEQVRCLWEPAWPGRTAAELTEIARHEALCNLAFSGRKMTLACLYDASLLSRETISWVESTHPVVITAGRERPGLRYRGAGVLPPGSDDPLPEPGPGAESLGFIDHLAALRVFAARHATTAGLGQARTRDLTLAVSEIAANALAHATGGVIRAWREEGELICQLEDSGQISDPLAGYRLRSPELPGGHGLRLVNQVCDLVERRTGPAGTVTRLHMRTNAS